MRRCRDLPGYELFQYEDADELRSVTSDDVNLYLRQAMGDEFTAKAFRTWAGTVGAATLLAGIAVPRSATAARRASAQIVKQVAELLRNTPAVCRNAYIHPAVLAAFESGVLHEVWRAPARPIRGLGADEARTLRLLESRASMRTRAA